MIFDLMDTGSLPHWWDYVIFVLCVLILVAGPAAIWLIRATDPNRRAK